MRNVTTYSSLKKELKRIRDKALKRTSDDVVEHTKDRINTDVYAAGNPSKIGYERSYQLRDSVFAEDIRHRGSLAEITVRHDWESMRYDIHANRYYSHTWNPTVYTQYVAETVHDGTSGIRFGVGFWTRPRPYMDNTKSDLISGDYRFFMANRLRDMGYKIK